MSSGKEGDSPPIPAPTFESREPGAYLLRSLLEDVQLSTEPSQDPRIPANAQANVYITCVELWDDNLYIGTSAAEILHYVLIPPDPQHVSSKPNFILASRVQPQFSVVQGTQATVGVQQILLLPRAGKACVLCNGTLTFYSLPELSPAFGTTQVRNCNWVGGLDLDANEEGRGEADGELIMICVKTRIQLVKVHDERRPFPIRNFDIPGALASTRRSGIACVANAQSYALLDVNHQQKIPLFPISTIDGAPAESIGGKAEDIGGDSNRSFLQAPTHFSGRAGEDRGHGRSTSLGAFVGGLGRRQDASRPRSQDRGSFDVIGGSPRERSPVSRALSPGQETPIHSRTSREGSPEKPLPSVPPDGAPALPETALEPNATHVALLKPHILSPTPNEFLLTTGVSSREPGVGIFVNLEGDVCRSTIEFEQYPQSLVVDGEGAGTSSQSLMQDEDKKGYILASIERTTANGTIDGLEIQRWDVGVGEAGLEKAWIEAPQRQTLAGDDKATTTRPQLGVRITSQSSTVSVSEVSEKLRLVRLRLSTAKTLDSPASGDSSDSRTGASLERLKKEMELFDGLTSGNDLLSTHVRRVSPPDEDEESREQEERTFAQRFSRLSTQVIMWKGNNIWWLVRSPSLIRIDAILQNASESINEIHAALDRRSVVKVVHDLRNQEPATELQFLSLGYLRQKASLLLFSNLMWADLQQSSFAAKERDALEESLTQGGADPRLVLISIPTLHEEVLEGPNGIWIHRGVNDAAVRGLTLRDSCATSEDGLDWFSSGFLGFVQRFLTAWRRKKGFGSIAEDKELFLSVDAALIRVLLELDKRHLLDPNGAPPVRTELYAIVDGGIECFDRAVELLEKYRRLYVLSRLYQSRKMSGKVLATWRRVVEGETDEGGELTNGEAEIRRYLTRLRDATLVEEYGTWLAVRNPKLGVTVFADDESRVKFKPSEVVQLLKRNAPNAVKEYLEHLVFHNQYVDDLIAFYLDTILSVLETSDSARTTLIRSYETYRALQPPRPTYRQFVTENAIEEEWWQTRLRLLQLLGGSHGAASEYDVSQILNRIEPFEDELVPEMIILDGKQARHRQAIRLLTHGLGDFDTAINYCLLGGSSIFYSSLGAIPKEAIPSREEQATLFEYLLLEFLAIEDVSHRLEQTGILLERFGGWYDIRQVLDTIPDSWSIELVSSFLISAFRRMVQERNETTVAKALSGAENLKVSAAFIGHCEKAGPSIEAAE
ncbi:MAG: hypothetical protein M1833_001089 [Piccolia ochrophora]|nr:MAG: hypothetical protein M1833_001089 [Piccolia ochrophora]